MKSKEAFLDALQQGIAVLAESEQQDILEEYAQHIEMKISGGLTEEEAIQDFGDIHQLIAEILEAYHVNPSYVAAGGDHPNGGGSIEDRLTGLGRWIQSGARKIAHSTKSCPPTPSANSEQGSEESPSAEEQPGVRDRKGSDSRPVHMIGRSCGNVLKATAWLVWNGMLLLCAMPVVCMGMTALLVLGVIVVLLTQGMPLVGSLLCCVGALASCVGVLGLGKNLIWHRHRTEVCHENETHTEKEVLNDAE